MKIVVVCRTRNEAMNIARFCRSYAWADAILIADGGSTDTTLDIARLYPNVKIDLFTERVYGDNGVWRNPYGRHINFLIEWALSEGADWIIFDDCDCVPTLALQETIRGLLSDTDKQTVYLYRLYVWGTSEYFPELNIPGQSLYTWHSSVPLWADESDPWEHAFVPGWDRGARALYLEHPHCCLHYFCPDPTTVERKLTFYRESGEQPGAVHPLESCGPLELLPEWAKWR